MKPVGVWVPNRGAVGQCFVPSVKQECLDHFIVFGEEHLRRILAEYLAYRHREGWRRDAVAL